MAATDMSQKDGASNSNSCWKKQHDENQSFWDNLKSNWHVFTHTPMEDHKNCFKLTLLAMKDKFPTLTKSDSEGQKPSD